MIWLDSPESGNETSMCQECGRSFPDHLLNSGSHFEKVGLVRDYSCLIDKPLWWLIDWISVVSVFVLKCKDSSTLITCFQFLINYIWYLTISLYTVPFGTVLHACTFTALSCTAYLPSFLPCCLKPYIAFIPSISLGLAPCSCELPICMAAIGAGVWLNLPSLNLVWIALP